MEYLISVLLALIMYLPTVFADELQKLKISENKRFLIKEDGTPFIWIGDTFWDWYKIQPEELDEYLNKRASQGYTVIQMQIGAYGRANYAGDWCFGGSDHKDITKPQEAFWQYSDLWMKKIKEHGLYAAVGLSWIINHWSRYDKAGDPTVRFSEEDYYNYGKWIGNRYKQEKNIIWLGINESTYQNAPDEKIRAVLRGIRGGDTGDKLVTLHPLAGSCTSKDLGDIVDFNSWQTARFLAPEILPYLRAIPPNIPEVKGEYTVWEAITSDYSREPVKPVIDLEAWYENAPDDMTEHHSTGSKASAWHVRRRAWFTILAGAFGHTYGAYRLARLEYNVTGESWRQALDLPGGDDMGHIAKLLGDINRPFLKLIPDQELLVGGQSDNYDCHKQAARALDGTFAYVYTADGSSFSVDLKKLGKNGQKITARWFDPREGIFNPQKLTLKRTKIKTFKSPVKPTAGNDWILVLSATSEKEINTIILKKL